MADARRLSTATRKFDDWGEAVSTDNTDGPSLMTFGSKRSCQSRDRFQTQRSAGSSLSGIKKSMKELEESPSSHDVAHRKSLDLNEGPATAVKRAMRARVVNGMRLPLICEMNEESDQEEQKLLVEISSRQRGLDRVGGRQGDAINQSVLADTPGAESYVPYAYGSFRVETGILGANAEQKKSRLPNLLPSLASLDLSSESEDERDCSEPKKGEHASEISHELSIASNSTNLTNLESPKSFMSTVSEMGRTKKSASLYKSLRGRRSKDRTTATTKTFKAKTHFISNVPQNTLMSDLTTILETKFCCGVQRKKNELRVAASLGGQASALVVGFSATKNATVIVTFRKSKVDFAKTTTDDFITFYTNVRTAFENMHGKESVLARDDEAPS